MHYADKNADVRYSLGCRLKLLLNFIARGFRRYPFCFEYEMAG